MGSRLAVDGVRFDAPRNFREAVCRGNSRLQQRGYSYFEVRWTSELYKEMGEQAVGYKEMGETGCQKLAARHRCGL
eukprot:552204-Pleurochrysis_carterae.AAC.1